MTKQNFGTMTDAQLVDLFAHYAKQYGEGVDFGEVKNSNRAFRHLKIVSDILRSRGSSSRQALTALLTHSFPAVRYLAAHNLLALTPSLARSVIEAIAEPYQGPISMYARGTLERLDSGFLKPT